MFVELIMFVLLYDPTVLQFGEWYEGPTEKNHHTKNQGWQLLFASEPVYQIVVTIESRGTHNMGK